MVVDLDLFTLQLPQHAQWASSGESPSKTSTQGLTLQQIQLLEAEQMRKDQEQVRTRHHYTSHFFPRHTTLNDD